jgi:hypothetical protein
MVDVTPIVPTLAAVYLTSGTTAAISDEAMQEVNMTSLGYPRYTVYEIINPAKRYLDRGVTPVFQHDSGGDNNFVTQTGTVEFAGGRIVLSTPRGSSDVVRCHSGNYFTTITKCMGASVSKLTTGPQLVEVPLLGDAYVRRHPTLRDFSLSVDSFLVLTQAEVTSTADAANGHLTFRHVPGGTAGNTKTVEIADPGSDGVLSITTGGDAVTVTLAYSSGAATSTALQVLAAFNADPSVKALGLIAELPSGSTGAGLMADSTTPLALAGGMDYNDFYALYGTPLIVMMYANTTNDTRMEGYMYIETEDWTFDPKNVVMETINFKGDGPLYYRPA